MPSTSATNKCWHVTTVEIQRSQSEQIVDHLIHNSFSKLDACWQPRINSLLQSLALAFTGLWLAFIALKRAQQSTHVYV